MKWKMVQQKRDAAELNTGNQKRELADLSAIHACTDIAVAKVMSLVQYATRGDHKLGWNRFRWRRSVRQKQTIHLSFVVVHRGSQRGTVNMEDGTVAQTEEET